MLWQPSEDGHVIERFIANIDQYVHSSPWLAPVAVFVGGVLTASNPCVLAMVPLMMSVVAGRRERKPSFGRSALFSFVFVCGLAVTFAALGVVAALAGKVYGEVSGAWTWIVAVVCVLMGLHLAGIVSVPIPSLGGRFQPKTRGYLGALLLGLLFGLVSAPCAAPILIVLLTYLASAGASVVWGAVLLLLYALGHSVLILIAGTSMGAARILLENRNATRPLEWLRRGAGVVVVLVGLYFALKGSI
jgi:cytochrome c biogenesis protein CcdA